MLAWEPWTVVGMKILPPNENMEEDVVRMGIPLPLYGDTVHATLVNHTTYSLSFLAVHNVRPTVACDIKHHMELTGLPKMLAPGETAPLSFRRLPTKCACRYWTYIVFTPVDAATDVVSAYPKSVAIQPLDIMQLDDKKLARCTFHTFTGYIILVLALFFAYAFYGRVVFVDLQPYIDYSTKFTSQYRDADNVSRPFWYIIMMFVVGLLLCF
jgi:hypothetical protein